MLLSSQKKISLTFLCYTAFVFTLVASSNAHIHQRDHVNLKRLIRKRSPFPQEGATSTPGPVAGAGAAVPTFSTTESSAISLPTPSGSSSSASDSSLSSQSSSSSSASQSSSASDSSATTSGSSTTSQTSISTSATESSPSPAAPSESLNIAGPLSPSTPVSKSIVTLTQSVDPSQTAAAPPPQNLAAATKPKSAIVTILIVVASSIAGIAILWTIFRKWKLGRSSKFDERLQPINWQPTNDTGDLPGLHRRLSGASSFRSGSDHPTSARGHGGSDLGHTAPTYAIPDHDFTAGPATLAPVGGYADLARGTSPKPQMNQITRGPSMTRPAYDLGVPLHHQGGYGTQNAFDYGGSNRY